MILGNPKVLNALFPFMNLNKGANKDGTYR
jgi:hypothetical protein